MLFATVASSLSALACADEAPALPLWELGGVGLVVSQQAYPGSSARVDRGLALPYLVYRGRILRADRGSAGLRALKTEHLELDVGVAAAFGSNADDDEARRGMPDLGTLVEIGPRLKWTLGSMPGGWQWRAEFPLRGVFDLSNDLARKGTSFEPSLRLERRTSAAGHVEASIGAVFGSRRLGETFYGVAPAYATAQRPAYDARGGLIAWRLGATASMPVGRDLRVFGFARVDTVAGAANRASPLVDKRTGVSAGVGLSYTFARSARGAED